VIARALPRCSWLMNGLHKSLQSCLDRRFGTEERLQGEPCSDGLDGELALESATFSNGERERGLLEATFFVFTSVGLLLGVDGVLGEAQSQPSSSKTRRASGCVITRWEQRLLDNFQDRRCCSVAAEVGLPCDCEDTSELVTDVRWELVRGDRLSCNLSHAAVSWLVRDRLSRRLSA
jgi:hypothetical protein